MASDSRALWDDSDWLSWPVVGDRRGRRVLGALAGAPLCSSQCGGKKKDEATTQAIICTILSASDTFAVDISLESRWTEERDDDDEDLEEVPEKKVLGEKILAGEDNKRLFCMVFDAFFFPGGLWDSCEGSAPPMTVCLPVRMGTVSACDWMPVLALPSGWSLHCGTASEWHGEWRGCARNGREWRMPVVSLRMNARVLSVLSQSVLTVWEGVSCGRERGRERPLSARRWNNSFLSKTREVVFVLVQLLNVQCIM